MALKHSVYDTDTHFFINPTTRALINESSSKNTMIQYDHNSERITFEIPRYIEGHDMSLCDLIQVHYNNINSTTKEQNCGVYKVDDMQISPEDENIVILSWLISGNATKYVGSLNFLIRFACAADDGTLYYVWNTAIYSGISVSSGIYNGDVVAEEYTDILAQWEKELMNAGGEGVNMVEEAANAAVDSITQYSEQVKASLPKSWVESGIPITLSDGYVYNGTGEVRPGTAGNQKYSSISVNVGETYRFNITGTYTTDGVWRYTGCGWSVTDSKNKVVAFGRYSEEQSEYEIVIPKNGKFLNITADASTVLKLFPTTKNISDFTKTYIENISTIPTIFPFSKIGIVGDSLAAGCTNYTGGVGERMEYSWGNVLKRKYGVDVTIFARGGHSTRSWLADTSGTYRGLGLARSTGSLECYIIGLGVNDMASLGQSYLGTIADVNIGSEASNADTYYGNYSKIIAELKAISPRCKIFCITMPNTAGGTPALRPSFVQAIKDVCALYDNVYVIDSYNDDWYNQTPFTTTRKEAHYNAVGYQLVADHLYEAISNYINSNLSEFDDIQWIIENHD